MAVPWLRLLDAVIGVTDLARSRKMGSRPPGDDLAAAGPAGRALGQIETRLAGVVVAALKEAFDRDSRRLDLEREQMEAERARAERALRLELMRQSGERELARLRLLAGVAVASWIGTLFFSSRLIAAGLAARVLLGSGWALLLAAVATSFVAPSSAASGIPVELEAMASCRAKASNCSSRCRARRMPCWSAATRSRIGGGSSTESRFSACRLSAAIGVRSSWAASAMKRFCCSMSPCVRASSPLIAAMKGCSSRGMFVTGSGAGSSARRASRSSAWRISGRSEVAMTSAVTSIRQGNSATNGTRVRNAMSRAVLSRMAVG